ncbi:MAG TPA: tRNA (adenosine(37)-N6)-threonylcarbamoyltransferase complex ATPase subunit type 1 TsaE [Spirochaetia bacterium]|nr:tRNA (adenosine(37)-N6)-threonylcarbamoyltransferase complex ATPase subunit type 1 TsaE [Spirochaetaceae bacterium]HPE90218.1 tRNA (adenosine(37)-N6)-threonylcarbamoyltransferase complex ATPase subunit type 1 TsaE [Spirochaetales bacterium]HRW24744.1 tRNA (adenosine(37)-N6)-threonylcarbamoyltransferase complex ATPase subunit type 1 TsaE [Spirochaetia bacterium]
MRLECPDVESTERLGERIGEAAPSGTVIAFRGGLGAGKTAMCRGIARGLGVSAPVTSPTYTLINEYDGDRPFYHFDAYRLSSADEFDQLDAKRYFYGDGVCAVEWSERVAEAMPPDAVVIDIEPSDDGSRVVTISGSALEGALA